MKRRSGPRNRTCYAGLPRIEPSDQDMALAGREAEMLMRMGWEPDADKLRRLAVVVARDMYVARNPSILKPPIEEPPHETEDQRPRQSRRAR